MLSNQSEHICHYEQRFHCHIAQHLYMNTVHTTKAIHSYQWMKVLGPRSRGFYCYQFRMNIPIICIHSEFIYSACIFYVQKQISYQNELPKAPTHCHCFCLWCSHQVWTHRNFLTNESRDDPEKELLNLFDIYDIDRSADFEPNSCHI